MQKVDEGEWERDWDISKSPIRPLLRSSHASWANRPPFDALFS